MDALELLSSDHEKVRGLFHEFRTASESDDSGRMGELSKQIFHELEVHTAIEEEVFYPAIRDAGDSELGETTDESWEEHHVVDLLMAEIKELAPGEASFKAKMTVLIENVEHHAQEEEDEMFPQVRELLGQDRLAELGEELQQAKERHELESSTKAELEDKARDLGIEGRSNMSKDELAEAVRQQAGS